ncbi:carbonic anhydrase [Frondihabitans australicus]|uniref:Carbonic anhydrase n=1 Tax=Frondihabitans australicus TaxID=386892 RepID=A0A495IIR2_9MICO|nr:carbonic anhydrase [Frondihabitans australicus]RKR74986.1 carbonic anhydrase [Frondihabitans australicus]
MSEHESAGLSPRDAWATLAEGNERFIAGEPAHPHQGVDRRDELTGGQQPIAAILGCSDSRVTPEIVFDTGLGDVFVTRNAGQVVSDSVLGTLEYAVGVLGVPVIVVLGHSSCGAVAAAIGQAGPEPAELSFHLQGLIAQIVPDVAKARGGSAEGGAPDPATVGHTHVESSVGALLEKSIVISDAVAGGTVAVIGATYDLATGRVDPHTVVGTL